MTSRKDKSLDPEVKKAGLRILERAIGEVEAKDGDAKDLKEAVYREILSLHPELESDPETVRNIGRFLAANFFRIVTGDHKTPSAKKSKEVINKFAKESKIKYIESTTKTYK